MRRGLVVFDLDGTLGIAREILAEWTA